MSDCDEVVPNKSERGVKADDQEGPFGASKVMKNIFSSCDVDGTGMVLVSKLVDYIKPYLQENLDALVDLKRVLDPDGFNRRVDGETFFTAMSDWAKKMSRGERTNLPDESRNVSNERTLIESTSLAHDVLTNCVESVVNVSSAASPNICAEMKSPLGMDRLYFDEQLNELEYQKKKTNEELDCVRQELMNTIELNEMLHVDIDKLKKKLSNEQKANEQLQEKLAKEWDLEETLGGSQKQVAKLTKTVCDLEKSNDLCKKDLEAFGLEKVKIEEKLAQMNKSYEEVVKTVVRLQSEVDGKEQEISSMEELNSALRNTIAGQQNMIEHCNQTNERLKVEKSTLEKLLRERVDKNNSLLNLGNTKAPRFGNFNQISAPNMTSAGVSPSASPNVSIGSLESCDGDSYYKIHQIDFDEKPHESLHEEMSQAVTDRRIVDHQCDHNIKVIEAEHRILSLQCELMHHQNCTFIIQRHKEEIEALKRENSDCHEQLEKLLSELSDFKTGHSLSQQKELMLQSKVITLDGSLKEAKNIIDDMNTKLDGRKELEERCRSFHEKIDSLEAENSAKYIQIVELTMDNESLRQEARLKEENQIDKHLNYENEKKDLVSEKEEILTKMSRIELSNKTLIDDNRNLEQKLRQFQDEINTISADKRTLQLDKFSLQSQNENFKTQLENFKTLEENFANTKRNLRIQIENLESEKVTYEEKLAELNEQLRKITSEASDQRTTYEEIEAQNANLKTEADKLATNYKTLTNENEKLRKEVKDNAALKTNALEKLQCLETKFNAVQDNFGISLKRIEYECNELRMENYNLIAQKDALDRLVSGLNGNIDEILREKEDLISRLGELETKVEDYRNEKIESDELKHSLIKENKQLYTAIEKDKMAINKKDIDNKKLGLELVDLKLSCERYKDSNVLFERRNKKLIDDNEILKRTIDDKEKYLKSLNERIEEMKVEISYNNTMVKDISIVNATLEEELENKNEELSTCKLKIDANEKIVSNLRDNIEHYLQDLRTTKKTNDDLEESLDGLEDVQRKLESAKVENEDLREKLKQTEAAMQKLQDDYKLELKRKNGLENELRNAKSDSKKTKEQYNNALNERTSLLHDLQKQSERWQKIESDNETLLRDNDNLKLTIETLNKKIIDTAEENKVINDEILKLSLENKQLESEKSKKCEMIEDAKSALVSAHAHMQECKGKMAVGEETLRNFYDDELKKYKNENVKIRTEIETLTAEKDVLLKRTALLEQENNRFGLKIEEFLLEKEYLLAQKLELSKKHIENDYCRHCASMQSVLTKKTNADQLEVKNMILGEKIGVLEEQLAKEKQCTRELAQEKITRLAESKKLKEDLAEMAIVKQENDELRTKLRESQENCLKLIKDYSLVRLDDQKDEEIKELKTKLSKEKDAVNDTLGHIKTIKRTLCESRLRLEQATLNATNSWKSTLEAFSNFDELLNNLDVGPVGSVYKPHGALYEEIFKLKHQVHVTAVLLDNFVVIKKCPLQRNDAQVQTLAVKQPDQRPARKFSLKPATLIFQPSGPRKPTNSGDNVSGLLNMNCEDLVNEEDFAVTECNTHGLCFEDSLEQEASPNLNLDVLEDLGLCDDISLKNLSEREIEEKFTALVLAFTIDGASLRKRYKKQKTCLVDRERAFTEELSVLSELLEEYLSADQHSHTLDKLESILKSGMQISMSAERCGALNLENQQAKAICLMVNYVAILRQKLEVSNECQSTTMELYQKPSDFFDKSLVVKEDKEIILENRKTMARNFRRINSCCKFLRIIVWSLFLIFCTVFVQYTYDRGFQPIVVNWDWKSWEYHLCPILKKQYRNGPPPI